MLSDMGPHPRLFDGKGGMYVIPFDEMTQAVFLLLPGNRKRLVELKQLHDLEFNPKRWIHH